jgi:hypothetical protein
VKLKRYVFQLVITVWTILIRNLETEPEGAGDWSPPYCPKTSMGDKGEVTKIHVHRSELNKSEHGIQFADKICARPITLQKKKKTYIGLAPGLGAKPQIYWIESDLDPFELRVAACTTETTTIVESTSIISSFAELIANKSNQCAKRYVKNSTCNIRCAMGPSAKLAFSGSGVISSFCHGYWRADLR